MQTQLWSPLPSDSGQLMSFQGENGLTGKREIHRGQPNHSQLRKIPPPQMVRGWACSVLALSPRCPLIAIIYLPAVNTLLRFNVTSGLILCCPQLSQHLYCIELSTKRDEWLSGRYQDSKVEQSCKQAERQLGMLSTKQAAWDSGQERERRWSLKRATAKLVLNSCT